MIEVLLAEDDSLTRIGLLSIIPWEEFGYTIVGVAEHGQQALALALELKPDIVITDIRMPVLDGIQLMQAIQKELPKTKFIVLSAHNDFDYVREALKLGASDYLLKLDIAPDLLLEALQKASKTLLSNNQPHLEGEVSDKNRSILKKMILKEWEEIASMVDTLGASSFILEKNLLLVVCAEETTKNLSEQFLYYPDVTSIKTNLEELLKEYGQNYCCVIRNQVYVSLISLHDTFVGLEIRATKEKIERKISEFFLLGYNIRFKVYMSKLMQEFAEVREKYCAIHKEFYLATFQENSEINAFYQKTIENICDGIRNQSEESIKNSFKAIYAYTHSSIKEPEVRLQQGILTALIYETSLVFHELNYYLPNATGLELIQKQKTQCMCVDDFEECLKQIEVLCVSAVANSSTSAGDAVALAAKRIFEKEYANPDLSLSQVAEMVNISESYLSRTFKTQFGITPIQFLTQVRVTNAKRYLKISDLQIKDISSRVGYANSFYFTRIFKQSVGLTPSEYRQADRE